LNFKPSFDHILQIVAPFQLILSAPKHLCYVLYVHKHHAQIQILLTLPNSNSIHTSIRYNLCCSAPFQLILFPNEFLCLVLLVKQHSCCSPLLWIVFHSLSNLSLYSNSSSLFDSFELIPSPSLYNTPRTYLFLIKP